MHDPNSNLVFERRPKNVADANHYAPGVTNLDREGPKEVMRDLRSEGGRVVIEMLRKF